MMLETKVKNVEKITVKYLPLGSCVGLTFFILSSLNNFYFWSKTNSPYRNSVKYNEYTNWCSKADILLEIESVGCILYTHYIAFFLISGFLLFLAVLGSVSLTSELKDKQDLFKLVGALN